MILIISITFYISFWIGYLISKKHYNNCNNKLAKQLRNKTDKQVLDYVYNHFKL
jgi:hypothetical protein